MAPQFIIGTVYDLLSILIGVIGAALLFVGLLSRRRAVAAVHWPHAPGRIVSVAVREVWLGRGALYFPDIKYEYIVEGHAKHGTRIGFLARLPRFSSEGLLYELRRDYPGDREVRVWFDPTNVQSTVLEPGVPSALNFLLVCGATLLVSSVVVDLLSSTSR